jgi:hypothetical protein
VSQGPISLYGEKLTEVSKTLGIALPASGCLLRVVDSKSY